MQDTLHGELSCSSIKNRSSRSSRNASPARAIELDALDTHKYHGDKEKHFRPVNFECCTKRYSKSGRRYYEHLLSACNLVHLMFMIFAQTVIGGICMVSFGFGVMTMDWHVFLCTEGWHFYTLEAILAMAVTNTWGNVKIGILRRVRVLHLILQFFGVVHVLAGLVLILWAVDRRLYTTHCLLGIVTGIMSCITLCSGPLAIFSRYNQSVKFFHACLGLPTFLMSTVVIEMGLFHKKFQLFIGRFVCYLLGLDILIYTLYVTVIVLVNSYRRLNIYNMSV